MYSRLSVVDLEETEVQGTIMIHGSTEGSSSFPHYLVFSVTLHYHTFGLSINFLTFYGKYFF